MDTKFLTIEQAFRAMSIFLQGHYDRTGGKGELGAVLGDMQTNRTDGLPCDPAVAKDWLDAVERAAEKVE